MSKIGRVKRRKKYRYRRTKRKALKDRKLSAPPSWMSGAASVDFYSAFGATWIPEESDSTVLKMLNKSQQTWHQTNSSPIREAWNPKKPLFSNLKEMGLMVDPNDINEMKRQFKTSEEETSPDKKLEEEPPKSHVVEKIENIVKSKQRVKRESVLSHNLARWLGYLIRKYGEDYQAMARDPKNYFQQSWKKIRTNVRRFNSRPDLYAKYLENSEEMEVS